MSRRVATAATREPGPIAARIAAAVVLVLGFLPWYNWLPTGHDSVGYAWMRTQGIFCGLALAAAWGFTLASFPITPLWREGAASRLAARVDARPRLAAFVIALAAFASYATAAVLIFGRHPADVDDAVQLLQARAYARGSLWQSLGAHPEFLASTHDLVRGTRAFAQFPPGHPALLALGVLAGVPWLVGPMIGGVTIYAFTRLARLVEPRPTVAYGAALLLASTPFVTALAASYMNHVPTLCLLVMATYALARATGSGGAAPSPRPWPWALACGLALGASATIRPLDAVAFALPAGAWFLARALREPRRWGEAIAAGAGVLAGLAPMLWVNAHTTGHPLLLGYTALWGGAHDLGFHQAPYGPRHTPVRGFALVSFYFLLLQQGLFTSPIPALAFVVGGLLLARRVGPLDRYLLASGACLCLGYWAYWYRGIFLGPRFLLPLMPALALWTARFPAFVRERWPSGTWHRFAVYAGIVSLVVGATMLGPFRYRERHRLARATRTDLSALERQQGVENAVILVREHWGNALVARLWALGVPHPDAARAFDNVDLCRLDATVSRLEGSGADTVVATAALRALLLDSIRTVRKTLPGTTTYLTVENEARFTPGCRTRVKELDPGGLALAPIRYFEGRNAYVRDLHARDTLLAALYPGRPLWLLTAVKGGGVRLSPVDMDSARKDWATP